MLFSFATEEKVTNEFIPDIRENIIPEEPSLLNSSEQTPELILTLMMCFLFYRYAKSVQNICRSSNYLQSAPLRTSIWLSMRNDGC